MAEIRPIADADVSLERRIERLEQGGVVVRPIARAGELGTVRRRPGALKRLLEGRDD